MRYKSYLVLRSKKDTDATVRLQSDPILYGLRKLTTNAKLIHPEADFDIEDGSCVLFHFDDTSAIERLKKARDDGRLFTAVCFGSDIYRFERYLPSNSVADLYVMPTELHRQVLASQLYKPVYCIPECIDPTTGVIGEVPPIFPSKSSTRIVWFGYHESFYKGMASIMPIINMQVKSGHVSNFSLILDQGEFLNKYQLPIIPYRKETFRADAASFDYCILSHFALDLALNSYIKSPNKLITALMIGLIPIASNTPNYRTVLGEFGLQRFLFDSASDLDRILSELDPAKDASDIVRSGIVEALVARYSERRATEAFLNLVEQPEANLKSKLLALVPPMVTTVPEQRILSFTDHIKALLPSFRRSLGMRLKRISRSP